MLKLNLASGQRPFKDDWVNIDIRKQGDYRVDIIADCRKLSMYQNETIDVIVAHHLFEHFVLNDIDGIVGEWHRVLKKGGKMAIFVPNLWEIDKSWIEGRIDTFIHNVNTYGAYQGFETDLHKWGYSRQELIDRVCCWDGRRKKYDFDVRDINSAILNSDPAYQGADVALDWWILALEFTKK